MEDLQIKYVSLFDGLSDAELDNIMRLTVRQHFKKNEMILFEEDADTRLYIILMGMVKLTRINDDGREFIFSFLGEGDVFGELSILDDEIRSTNAVAVEKTVLMYIDRSDYQEIFQTHPQLTLNLLREMTMRLRIRDAHIKSLTLQSATGKVANTILRFADESGRIHMGQVEITRLPPHRDLANMVGTSRETISRAINWLTANGYLQKMNGRLVINDYENFRAAFF
jgi:CRP/FNR family cyclic AMP-dependent transcriptional regulator